MNRQQDRRQPRRSGPEPKSSTKNLMPRAVALGAVEGVLAKATPLDGALAGRPEWKRMEPRDRAFARAIASAVIRRPIALDAALMQVLDKPLPDEEVKAHLILRCGAAERLILETPAHAAVDAWVSLMAQDRHVCDSIRPGPQPGRNRFEDCGCSHVGL